MRIFSAVKIAHGRWRCIVPMKILFLLGIIFVAFGTDKIVSDERYWLKPQLPASFATIEEAPSNKPEVKTQYVIKKRFDERFALKNKVCSTRDYQSMPINRRKNMLALANKRIEVCRVPKVGTTYMQVIETEVLRGLATNRVAKGPAKRMIMVREPYSRLMSAYIGKIATNTSWQRDFGASIIRKFRPLATKNEKKCGHNVTFAEFLKYFIHADTTGWRSNEHFTPIYEHCNICSSHFDFIAHLETIKDDLSFILNTVNISTDMEFSDEEQTLRAKAEDIINERQRILKCGSMCSTMSKVWWSFQARGLISSDIRFTMTEERCKTIEPREFADLAWTAHLQSVGQIDKSKQKREALASLFLQASLEDRLKVRYLMGKDFELFGYEPQPDDIFPELKNN